MPSRPILLTGGAPRVPIDVIRHLTLPATGATALDLARRLAGLPISLLLSQDALPHPEARRFTTRADLDAAVASWVKACPEGVVVMSAAVNDYQVEGTEWHAAGAVRRFPASAKLPSGAEELVIRLRPAPKLIGCLPAWGHRGPLVAFKYEAPATVVASAQRLQQERQAALVVANSLDGAVQALVSAQEIRGFPDRPSLLAALALAIADLAG